MPTPDPVECPKSKLRYAALLAQGFALVLWLTYPYFPPLIPRLNCGKMAPDAFTRLLVAPNGPTSKALEAYKWDMGQYPTTLQGLGALCYCPHSNRRSHYRGPYVRCDRAELLDPWMNPFLYRYPGTHNPDSFDLYSSGPDGIDDSGRPESDDIANWHPQTRRSPR